MSKKYLIKSLPLLIDSFEKHTFNPQIRGFLMKIPSKNTASPFPSYINSSVKNTNIRQSNALAIPVKR